MIKINATRKGLITGAAILLASAITFYFKGTFDTEFLPAMAYSIYAIGILWTLLEYHKSNEKEKGLKAHFQQGFKCFIVVTLIMVCATWLFLKFNTDLRESMIKLRETELRESRNYMESDIQTFLKNYRQGILPGYTMLTIFSYLGIGTIITGLVSVYLTKIKVARK